MSREAHAALQTAWTRMGPHCEATRLCMAAGECHQCAASCVEAQCLVLWSTTRMALAWGMANQSRVHATGCMGDAVALIAHRGCLWQRGTHVRMQVVHRQSVHCHASMQNLWRSTLRAICAAPRALVIDSMDPQCPCQQCTLHTISVHGISTHGPCCMCLHAEWTNAEPMPHACIPIALPKASVVNHFASAFPAATSKPLRAEPMSMASVEL
jgi:hypothetical protein